MLELLIKILDKLVSKLTTPEELIFMSIVLVFGMLMIPLSKKYLSKRENPEGRKSLYKKVVTLPVNQIQTMNAVIGEVCPLTGEPPKCSEVPKILAELQKIVQDNQDVKNRCAKIMNVISKEYEGRWDRYLYDRELTPSDDGVRIRDDE